MIGRTAPWLAMLGMGLVPMGMCVMAGAQGQGILLEAEQFDDCGGWSIDQQFMDQMGSPYLLAHGMGVPVKDAVTTATVPSSGKYRVWVRTRDWVAPWKAQGAPGTFQVLVNDTPLKATFGTEGAEWHWQDGGVIELSGNVAVALHDLTGFEGRCDAVYFSSDLAAQPPNKPADLATFRRSMLGLPETPDSGGTYDLVVVGGGIAGASAALSAARNGLTVALVQDRPVLGGNGSSEVRVWPEGKTQQQPYPHIGDIVEEITRRNPAEKGTAKDAAAYADTVKLDAVRAEPRITLMLDQHVTAVEVRDDRIVSVVAQHIRTARRIRIGGRYVADCTGDGTVGFLAGADHEMSTNDHMGASNMWRVKEGATNAPFPRCPWALDLADKPFAGRKGHTGQWAHTPVENLGGWFWESGFHNDPIAGMEQIRDNNFRAMYGAWDVLKNVDKLYPNHRINWCAYIAGKRESRRLLGDVVLTGADFRAGRTFPDACFP